MGLVRNRARVFRGTVSSGQDAGASVRKSLPMPREGRRLGPIASA